MKHCVLLKTGRSQASRWAAAFAAQAPEFELRLWPDTGQLADIEYLVVWDPPAGLLGQLSNLKVLFSTGAGVDQFDLSAIPAQVQIVRMIEPGIVDTMVEYVTLAVMGLHRNLLDYRAQQLREEWRELPNVPAASRRIGVMGLGVLGQAVLGALRAFKFDLAGWNRSPRDIPGVRTFAGAAQLHEFLDRCDVLICLLPLTAATRGLLNQRLFDALPRGASLINVGRGAQLHVPDLLAALASGQLSTAVLDVTEPEPLPPGHPFWRHPRILLTPHIASVTQPETAAAAVIDNLRRHGRGEALHGLIDRNAGY